MLSRILSRFKNKCALFFKILAQKTIFFFYLNRQAYMALQISNIFIDVEFCIFLPCLQACMLSAEPQGAEFDCLKPPFFNWRFVCTLLNELGHPRRGTRREPGLHDSAHRGACPTKPQTARRMTAAATPVCPIKSQLSERDIIAQLTAWVCMCVL